MLLLGSGAVALAACDADPSTSTSPATTTAPLPSVQKNAGGIFAKDVILTVFNDTDTLIYVRSCMDNVEDNPQTREKWGFSGHTSLNRSANNTFEGVIA